MSSEQLHSPRHHRPKYPCGQVLEQFVPTYPGSHSTKDFLSQTVKTDNSKKKIGILRKFKAQPRPTYHVFTEELTDSCSIHNSPSHSMFLLYFPDVD